MDRSEVIEDAKAALAGARVERIARAIFASCNGPEGFGYYMDPRFEANADLFKDMARAAMEAMKPYDAVMIAAGYKALMDWDARTGDDAGIHEVWEAMIDAALSPHSRPPREIIRQATTVCISSSHCQSG